MSTILDKIVAQKRVETALLPAREITGSLLKEMLDRRGDRRDFAGALLRPRKGAVSLIAEIKKASPSAGIICPNFDPERIAGEYETHGATCLSILTDEKFFKVHWNSE